MENFVDYSIQKHQQGPEMHSKKWEALPSQNLTML